MRIQIARINVLQGQYEKNYQKVENAIKNAIGKYDMIIFQQNVITGMFCGHVIENTMIYKNIIEYNEKIKKLAKDIYVVWGNYYQKQQALCIAKNDFFDFVGKKNQDKQLFSESKYFLSGENFKTVYLEDREYIFGFGNQVINDKFHILFDAQYTNPTHEVSNGIWVNHFALAQKNKSVVVFDGTIYANNISNTTLKEENIDNNYMQQNAITLLDKVVFGIQQFDIQVFQKRFKWVIGLSGGLDSSVSAALFTFALGKERVIGYNLATKNNTSQTIQIAKQLANHLEIAYHEGNIQELVTATHQVLKKYGYYEINDLTNQNIQARLRGHMLSSFAAIENAVIVNNGNKVETALGYATLYGDLIGAFSPLADLTKVQLFDLVKQINQQKEIIPSQLIPNFENDKMTWIQMPSAELAENQFDPMKWFYHDYIIENLNISFTIHEFLMMFIEKSFPKEIEKWMKYYDLYNPKNFIQDIEWLVKTMQRNSFKLLQSPPHFVISSRSFSSDIDVVQMAFEDTLYEELKQKILLGGEYA